MHLPVSVIVVDILTLSVKHNGARASFVGYDSRVGRQQACERRAS